MITGVEKLLARLDAVRETGQGQWTARCPAHDDETPSLSIRERGDGVVLIHDFAGCDAVDVLGAVGLELRDLFPGQHAEHGARPVPARDRWDWRGLLRLLRTESGVVLIAANDVAAGRVLRDEDRERLRKAIARISSVAGVAS